VAVLGRSNVGKSSLLNALLGTKVARVSQTPGRTQALYWYRVDERFDVVDCPGYGYAKTAKGNRELFAALIEALLMGHPRPSAALLLVDGRLPAQDSDQSMALFLSEAGIPTIVAVTKWDAVKPSERFRRLRDLSSLYQSRERTLQPVSSETGEHLPDLARRIRQRISDAAPEVSTVTSSAKES
jgi:GTP-binding protein